MSVEADKGRWIEWLLSFRSLDLSHAAKKDIDEVRRMIEGFVNSDRLQGAGIALVAKKINMAGMVFPTLTKKQIILIQDELKNGLDALMTEGKVIGLWDLSEVIPLRVNLIRRPGRHGWIYIKRAADFPGCFWITAADLLTWAGARLQKCPSPSGPNKKRCDRLFLAKTRHPATCSEECSRKLRNENYYRKNRGKILKTRREFYERTGY